MTAVPPPAVLLHTSNGTGLATQLASLRCAACIAHAINTRLLIPRWRLADGAWQVVDGIDSEVLGAVSEEEAAPLLCDLQPDQVRCLHVGSSTAGSADHEGLIRLLSEILGFDLPVHHALRHATAVDVNEPWRSGAALRKSIADVGGLQGVRLLLLPALPPEAVSHSSSMLSAQRRTAITRAIGRPSARIREYAEAKAIAATVCLWFGELAGLAGQQREGVLARAVAAAERLCAEAQLGGTPEIDVLVIPEDAADARDPLLAGQAAVQLRALGLRASVLLLDDLAPLDGAFASRWLCTTCPLLLLPLRGRPTAEVLAARQSLGKPVDHAFYDQAADAPPATRSYAAAPATAAAAQATAPVADTPPASSTANIPTADTPSAIPAADVPAADVSAADTPSATPATDVLAADVPATTATDQSAASRAAEMAGGGASPGCETVFKLLQSRLGPHPELRGHILSFHPEATDLDGLAVQTPHDAYMAFQARSTPLLQRLTFAPALPGATDRVAVIVEPRSETSVVARTAYVMRNVCAFLNDAAEPCGRWAVQLFHGSGNREAIASHFSPDEFARVQCISLGVDNLRSSQEYSQLLTSHWFWGKVAAEVVLVFQEDTMLCGPSIEPYLKYDYVGAPWLPTERFVRGKSWLCDVGGNGGLSLRRRSQAVRCLDEASRQPGQWEDIFFIEALQRLGFSVAPAEAACHFAVERIYVAAPVGLHKVYSYLPLPQLEAMLRLIEAGYQRLLRSRR